MVAIDDFSNGGNRGALADPAEHAFLISPSDADELAHVTRGISFATAGALKIITAGGETIVIPSGNLAVGIIHACRARKVFATGTDAGGLVGWY